MFASQLLRILETIPSDVKSEICVFDSAEEDITMKEIQNPPFNEAKSFRREAYPLAMENEENYQLRGSTTDASSVAFDVKATGRSWNPFLDDFPIDIANGTKDSYIKENINEIFCPLTIEEDANTLSSDTNNMENIRGHESLLEVDELSHCNSSESRDSSLSCVATSDFCGIEKNTYTDKDVLDCELPEFSVCYKEINYHIVKDICVDEGFPVKDKISLGSHKHEESEHYVFKPQESNQFKTTEGGAEMEFFISDEIATMSMENNKHGTEDRCGIKEELCGDLFAQGKPKSLHENTAKHTASENSEKQAGEANCGHNDVTATDASKEESFIDKKLPIQEFGTRSFLRSFMSSLDCEENNVELLPDQIAYGKCVSEISSVSPTEAIPIKDIQATGLLYNSEVENGSITFKFDSLAPVVAERSENVNDQSVDSGNQESDSRPDASQVKITSDKNQSGENSHEISMKSKDEKKFDDTSSAANQVQSISNNHENSRGESPVRKDENSDDLLVRLENEGPNKHKRRNSDNVSVVASLQHDEGETSFSAAGLITYSGAIAYSGSLSIRSDGSATSVRSFAFPVLQTEWNSSPARMTKADRRDFRKHRGWRSGLLCCRF